MGREPILGNTSLCNDAAIASRVPGFHAEERCSSHAVATASSFCSCAVRIASFLSRRCALGSTPSANSCLRAIAREARRLQACEGNSSEADPLLDPCIAVLESPPLAARRCDLEIQTAAVEKANRLAAR